MNADFSYNIPALLFPTISLFFLSFTNRFVAMSQLTRNLIDEYQRSPSKEILLEIKNMKFRLKLLKNTQIIAIFSLIFATLSTIFLFWERVNFAKSSFGSSLLLLILSLVLTAWEIIISTNALEIELKSVEKFD